MKKAIGLHYGDLVLDETYLFGSRNGKPVHFTKSERALLLVLCKNPRRLMSRSRLLDELASSEAGASDRNIDFLINRLRAKLGDNARSPTYIATQYGEGYLWIAEPGQSTVRQVNPFLAILPSVSGPDVPALVEQFREAIAEGLGPHLGGVVEQGLAHADIAPRYSLRLSFHADRGQMRCTATLQEMPSRRIMKAFSSQGDVSAGLPAASLVSKLSDDVAAYLQSLMTSMTTGLGVPAELSVEERSWNVSNRLTTGSYQMWLAKGEQLGADRVSDTSTDTALQWCMHLFSRLVLASPFSPIDIDERDGIESEMEAIALQSMPVVENNPVQMLAVAKLLYFINRGHLELAQDIAERAAAQMTGSPAALPLLAQIYSALGQSDEACALFDRGIAMAGSNIEFLNHMSVLKSIALLAAGDSRGGANIIASIIDLGDHCPPDVAAAIRLMAAPTDRQLPVALAEALVAAGPQGAGNALAYLYFTSARQHASPVAVANLMRGFTTHVMNAYGEAAVPAFLRSALL
ncbi:winged helix-turn-helix domain-containing protein [Rhizobium subbaraonis]|nr:helix-turn-helix domain-containing protein [Rhizobium subbaraonis]